MATVEVIARRQQIGATIRQLREQRDMKQYELADKVNIKAPYLSQIENGERGGSAETLSCIAVALGVPLEVLLGKSPPEEQAIPA